MNRRTLILATAVVAILAAVAAYVVPQVIAHSRTRTRSESDRAAAIAAVATAEPARPRGGFSAQFWNPTGADIAVVQVQHSADSAFGMDVVVRWDNPAGRSRVISMKRVAPK